MTLPVAAVDLGASSVRVAVVDLEADEPRVDVVHRVRHGPLRSPDGTLRWDLRRILSAVTDGVATARDRSSLASIGVDAWGVDYGLVGADGTVLSEPFSYRDGRTANWHEVADLIGSRRLFERTGVQPLPINTIFQLAVHDPAELAAAARLLMMPDLIAYELSGAPATERTIAGTTGLVDLATGTWSGELLDAIGVPHHLFGKIETAPRTLGHHENVPVCLVAGHDTACAFAAAPAAKGSAIISSGTWMLVGTHVESPVTSEVALTAGLSNEPAFPTGYRLLRNIVGMWILDRCCTAWQLDVDTVLARADRSPEGPTFDASDDRFLNPPDMPATVTEAADLPDPSDVAAVAGCILRSLAHTVSRVLGDLAKATGRSFDEVVVVGGGVKNEPLNGLIEEVTGLPVRRGPAEATALGNALIQGLNLGRFETLEEARRWIR